MCRRPCLLGRRRRASGAEAGSRLLQNGGAGEEILHADGFPGIVRAILVRDENHGAGNAGQGERLCVVACARRFVKHWHGKRSGAFYEPTILADVTPDMDIARDMEVFGPVWPVIGFDTVDEAVEIANSSHFGLGGGLFSRNIYTCIQVARRLKTGHIAINGSGNFRAAELPFGGGRKMSGNSRESLSRVMDEVTQLKSIVFRYAFNERK